MHANGEPLNCCVIYFAFYKRTGVAKQIFNTEVNLDFMEDYEQVKNVFLTAMGDAPE